MPCGCCRAAASDRGALLSLLAGMLRDCAGDMAGAPGERFWLLTGQKFLESPSLHALSNRTCCESTHFSRLKWKHRSLTKKCVRGVDLGNAVNTGRKYSRTYFCFLSTILHVFNVLFMSAEPGFVLKVFSCMLHLFTTHRCFLFIPFCCFH